MAASTHPPFDPELSAVLAALPAELREPMTIEDIPARREAQAGGGGGVRCRGCTTPTGAAW